MELTKYPASRFVAISSLGRDFFSGDSINGYTPVVQITFHPKQKPPEKKRLYNNNNRAILLYSNCCNWLGECQGMAPRLIDNYRLVLQLQSCTFVGYKRKKVLKRERVLTDKEHYLSCLYLTGFSTRYSRKRREMNKKKNTKDLVSHCSLVLSFRVIFSSSRKKKKKKLGGYISSERVLSIYRDKPINQCIQPRPRKEKIHELQREDHHLRRVVSLEILPSSILRC